MLGLIVAAIMLGFPTAFTLMGLGMMFGYVALHEPGQAWNDNRVFDLMVQRTYGAMTNDTLLSIPLFVLMGYVMERAALVDKMFHSIQLAFRRLPASLAVATLAVCTFWGIASGLVGAVVVLMGVIALRPMLDRGYDSRLATGVIAAGGTLGILIPPSVMIIVYAAVAGQSVVKLYAAAMLPGFFLAFLYLAYIVGWALIDPKVAPRIPAAEAHAPIPPATSDLARAYSPNLLVALLRANTARGGALRRRRELLRRLGIALLPAGLAAALLAGTWWYVVVHRPADLAALTAAPIPAPEPALAVEPASEPAGDQPVELGIGQDETPPTASADVAGRDCSRRAAAKARWNPARLRRLSSHGSGWRSWRARCCWSATTAGSTPSASPSSSCWPSPSPRSRCSRSRCWR